jgi:hypothetical protein
MAYFLKTGNTYKVTDEASIDITKSLPAGNYTIKEDQYGNLFLEEIDAFTAPRKVYGDTVRNVARILTTFADRPAATGVMLSGEKGSGKSLLAKMLSITAAADGVPTIVINKAWTGDGFNTLIQTISQPCIVLFDEFEKVYDRDEQEEILTLLDGVYPTKKLFVITTNDSYRVDQHLRNRPGRIYYLIDYKGLEANFIQEYCEENLKAKEHTDTIVKISTIFSAFNFDMLKAMVEEMNRYGETPQEVLKVLNVKQEFDDGAAYNIKLRIGGVEITDHDFNDGFHGNPLRPQGHSIDYDPQPEDSESEYTTVSFSQNDLTRLDAQAGVFEFTHGTAVVTFEREKAKEFNYMAF